MESKCFLVNCLCPVIHCDTLICGNHPPHLGGAAGVYCRSQIFRSWALVRWQLCGPRGKQQSCTVDWLHSVILPLAKRDPRGPAPLSIEPHPPAPPNPSQYLTNPALEASVLEAVHENKGFPIKGKSRAFHLITSTGVALLMKPE